MPKKKKFGIDIIVDDKGTLKNTGKKAKKAAGSFDVLSQSSRQADRAGKGLARTSSNATKNFSKMSQGISGGLVPAYAVMAANIFALSAAFRFLQDSFDTRNMIRGQEAFGSLTGVAYQTLTRDVQDATEGMLKFKDAAEAVAIGVAAGLTASQLTALGNAAKNVSLALGRNLEDSFQRLIRGVTKAEPELLDELGIVLRLENATRKYAISIGKSREELTAFERTQAVANDVLEQTERKFGRIAEIMDPEAFAFAQLGKEFDDMVTTFKVVLAETLLPIIKFLNENLLAFGFALLAMFRPIMKAILPDFDTMTKSMTAKMDALTAQNLRAGEATMFFRTEVDKLNQSLTKSGKKVTKGAVKASRYASATTLAGFGIGGGVKGQTSLFGEDPVKDPVQWQTGARGGLLKRETYSMTNKQIEMYRNAILKKQGIFENFTRENQETAIKALEQQRAANAAATGKITQIVAAGESKKQMLYSATTLHYKKMQITMVKWSKIAATRMMWLFGIISKIGFAIIMVQMVWSLGAKFFGGLDKEAKRAKERTDKVIESLKGVNDELARMVQVRGEGLLTGAEGLTQIGNALTSVDLKKKLQEYNEEAAKGFTGRKGKKHLEQWKEFGKHMSSMNVSFKDLATAFDEGKQISLLDDWTKELLKSDLALRSASQALALFEENQRAVAKAIEKTVAAFAKLPFQDIVQPLQILMEGMDTFLPKEYDEALNASIRATQTARADYERARRMSASTLPAIKTYGPITVGKPTGETEQDIYKKYGVKTIEELKKKLEDIVETEEESRLGLKAKIRLYLENKKLLTSFLEIQKDALKNERDSIQNQLKLARVGPGSSAYHKNAKEQYKLEQQQNKESKAAEDIKIAQAYEVLTLNRVLNQIADEEKDTGIKLTAEKKKQRFDDSQAYQNAVQAVFNSKEKLKIQQQTTFNVKAETTLQKLINNILQQRQNLSRSLTIDAQTRALAAAKEARALAITGTRGGRARLAMAGVKGMKGEAGGMAEEISGLEGDRKRYSAAAFGKSLPGGRYDFETKMFAGTTTEAQDKYNDTQTKINAKVNEHALLWVKIGQEIDRINNKELMANLKFEHRGIMFQRERVYTLNPLEQKAQDMILEKKKESILDLTPTQIAQIREMAYAQAELNIQVKLMKGIQDTLSQGFTDMFLAMVDGTETFTEAMKKMFANFMQKMADMFAEAVALRIMMNFTGGLFGGSIPATGARSGGILKAPGYKSFQGGGYASGPSSGYLATLHGNEAVIPLGNDRSIPVKFEKGGGSVSNITVNVTAGGQQQTTTSKAGERERKLGQLVATAVQAEILDQQRPGGILSPYGDGSI